MSSAVCGYLAERAMIRRLPCVIRFLVSVPSDTKTDGTLRRVVNYSVGNILLLVLVCRVVPRWRRFILFLQTGYQSPLGKSWNPREQPQVRELLKSNSLPPVYVFLLSPVTVLLAVSALCVWVFPGRVLVLLCREKLAALCCKFSPRWSSTL